MLQFTQQQLAQVGIKARAAMAAGADWSLSPLFASQNWPPTLFNTAFYSNPQVDKDLAAGRESAPVQRGAGHYLERARGPLVVEKLVSAHNKALTGFYIMPDTGFSFDDAV
ncbi:glutathione-binding protein GsiB domain protein [Enterobacter hormaechei subsp. xiangfangensis]|nr:glutathione-binding protein GsiB domain protein [Enterobacter hormaechei subsp. xiangfangensis]